MCGLFGWTGTPDLSLARRLRDRMAHRGPDGIGEWVDEAVGVWLGHRRLAIVDLSPNGAQPMRSPSGRWVMVYNGEVYNKDALRAEAEAKGIAFRGHSDTEAMLAAIELFGVRGAVERFVGMFAFTVWDRERREMWLARDRLGIKPMYWAQAGGQFAFSSELDALRLLPWVDGAVDRGALAAYFRHLAVPAPRTIIAGASKLMPGTLLCWDGKAVRTEPYWSVAETVAKAKPFAGSFEDAVEELDARLTEAVKLRLMSDVPLGAFLSGGIDSATVAALMAKTAGQTIDSYTIGFDEPSHDESEHARAVAAHLGTRHHEERLTSADVQALVPESAAFHDEPFADGSSLPTYLLSRFARRHVTVALSGDGGDELFAGYNRYFWATRVWRTLRPLPQWLRRAAGCGVQAVPPAAWDAVLRLAPKAPRLAGDKMHKLAGLFDAESEDAVYRRLLTHWPEPEQMVAGSREPRGLIWDDGLRQRVPDFMARMQLLDTLNYLPDDILTKVDRATMAVSLEGRVPLIDHRLVAFAWSLPKHQKVRDGQGKWLLRRVLDRYVPRGLIDRPKMGFAVPIDDWLRGPLRDWAEALLARPGPIEMTPVRSAWAEHQSGKRNWQYHLWAVLMFQAWSARWL